MNQTIKLVAAASAAFMLLSSASAYAQAGPASASTTASAPAPASKKAARAANRQLARQVRAALTKAKPTLPMYQIAVLAKNGAVSLVGEIENNDQGTQAAAVAKTVPGVVSVNNLLRFDDEGQ